MKVAVAEMYVNGVSIRKVKKICEKMCGVDVTSMEVSHAAEQLDEELEKWRNRPLGEIPFLQVDPRYKDVRMDG